MKQSRKRIFCKQTKRPAHRPILKHRKISTVETFLAEGMGLYDERNFRELLDLANRFHSTIESLTSDQQRLFHTLRAFTLLEFKSIEPLETEIATLEQFEGTQLDIAYLESRKALQLREYEVAIDAARRYLEMCDSGNHNSDPASLAANRKSEIVALLGESLVLTGNQEEGLEKLRFATDLSDCGPAVWITYVRLLNSTGQHDRARTILAQASERWPENPELQMLGLSFSAKPTISACMIVKNEEKMLAGCLDSIRDWVDEIIIVDTGSEDGTKEIAKEYGAKLYEKKWQDNFSLHRNQSLAKATSDWILVIDADERITAADIPALLNKLKTTDSRAVALTVENRNGDSSRVTSTACSVRLFRRELNLKYHGIVHNELRLPPGEKIVPSDVRLIHYGYHLDLEKMTEKFHRTKRLLEKQIKSEPNNPYALFNYAQQLCNEDASYGSNNAGRVVETANRTINLVANDPTRRHLWIMSLYQLAQAYTKLEDFERAIDYCDQALAMKPNYLDAFMQAGFASVKAEQYDAAVSRFQKYLHERERFDPARDSESLILWHCDSRAIALNNLGLIAEIKGNKREAIKHYEALLEIEPEHQNGKNRLARISVPGAKAAEDIWDADVPTKLHAARNAYLNGHASQTKEILNSIEPNQIEQPEHEIELLRLRAFILVSDGKFDQAEKVIERGSRFDPNAADFYYLDCFVKLNMKENEAALAAADKFLALAEKQEFPASDIATTSPHVSQAFNFKGVAHLNLTQNEAAKNSFKNSIARDKSNHLPYLNYIRLARSTNRSNLADRLIEDGLKNCSDVQELKLLSEWSKRTATVSACMIVKNEEKLLPGCLDSIRDWVDEIVIVDTGSTDNTVEIAESYRARLFHQPWEGDFSRHRNYSIEQATGDWVFIIDADERFEESGLKELLQIINDPAHQAISINVYNYYEQAEHKVTAVNSLRFFRRELGLRYTGIVHNQIDIPDSLRITRSGICINHLGYDLDESSMQRKFERTRALLEKQLNEDPDFAFGWFNLAQLYRGRIFENRDEYGRKIIEAATRAVELSSPTDQKSRYIHLMALDQLGWTYLYLNEYAQAEECAQKALGYKKDYLDPLMLLGHIYANSKRFPESIAAYQEYLRVQAEYNPARETDALILVHPDSRATAFFGIGSSAEMLGDIVTAKKNYRKALEIVPGYLTVPLALGRIYLSEGDLARAEKYFQLQYEKSEPSIHALLGLAHVASLRGDHRKAELWLLEGLELASENPNLLSQYAYHYLQTNRPQDALRMFERVRNIVTDDPSLDRQIAELKFSLGMYEEALGEYSQLLTNHSSDSSIINDYANCCFKLEQFGEAEKYYRQAIEADKSDLAALRNLSLSLFKQNKQPKAIDGFEKYLDMMPEDDQVRLLLADLQIQNRMPEKGIVQLESFLSRHPADPFALTRLADAYLLLGHEDSARLGYQRALEIAPGYAPARDHLSRLSARTSTISRS